MILNNGTNRSKNRYFPYLASCFHAMVSVPTFYLNDIYFLRYNVMGNPFCGRAKGAYWTPFLAPMIDQLHKNNRRNT